MPHQLASQRFAQVFHADPAKRIPLELDGCGIVDLDRGDGAESVVAIAYGVRHRFVTGHEPCAALDAPPDRIVPVSDDEIVALPFFNEAACVVVAQSEATVRILRPDEPADAVVFEFLGAKTVSLSGVRDLLLHHAPEPVGQIENSQPGRVDTPSQFAELAILVATQLAPVVDFLDNTAHRIARELVSFAALVDDANEPAFRIVLVFDAGSVQRYPFGDSPQRQY